MMFWMNTKLQAMMALICAVGIQLRSPAAATNQPPSQPSAAPKDIMEFLNGDILRGTFLSYDSKNGVRWQHASIKQVLSVKPQGLARIRLQRPHPSKPGKTSAYVKFINGDELAGDLISLDEEKMTLETWYAGTLSIPRSALASIVFGVGKFGVIYEGPTSADGWVTKSSANAAVFARNIQIINGVVVAGGQQQPSDKPTGWQFKDDAFYCIGNGTLGRDVKLPPLVNIEFDIAWRGVPNFAVHFYTDSLDANWGNNAYVLQFSYRNAYLRRQSPNTGGNNLGSVELPDFAQRAKARISIRCNREQKSIALLVDDVLLKQWIDTGNLGGQGTGLLFWQQSQSALRISNIRITEWDGRLDSDSSATALKEDLMTLANKDKVTGKLKAFRDDKVVFATAFATLQVPVERVSRVFFAVPSPEPPPIDPAEVSLFFADRGKVTLNIERWDEQQIVGKSSRLGAVKLIPAAFSSLQFNLGKKKLDTDVMDSSNLPVELWVE